MGFDRSKFKGASLDAMQAKRKEAEAASGSSGYNNDFHKIEQGKNVFRILPAHDPIEPPFQPERRTFLECEVDKKDDDGNVTGSEVKNKPIFIATVHGIDKEGNPMTKDPIETYIEYVKKKVYDEVQDRDEQKKQLNPVYGYMAGNKYVPGIRPNTNYVYYALDGAGKIGRLQLYPSIVQKMEEMSIQMQNEDNPSMVDIFSDPDNGINLEITYNKSGKKGEKYLVGKTEFTPQKFKDWSEYIASMRISDEVLKQFSEMKPLKELYGQGVYKMSDFDYAIDGLSRFDQKHGYGVFANDEFLDELEAIKDMIPETPMEAEKKRYDKAASETFQKPAKQPKQEVKQEPKPEPTPQQQPQEEEESQQEQPKADITDRLAKLRQKSQS